jgi:hypothetical protein
MGNEALPIILFGGLHLVMFALGALLLLPCLKDERPAPWASQEDDDEGGGGNDRVRHDPPRGPRPGGIPLPDALPARVRLRGPDRLADLLPGNERRPAHAPVPGPARRPARTRGAA